MKTHTRKHRHIKVVCRKVGKVKTDLPTTAEERKLYYLETAEEVPEGNTIDLENEDILNEMPEVDPTLSAGAGI